MVNDYLIDVAAKLDRTVIETTDRPNGGNNAVVDGEWLKMELENLSPDHFIMGVYYHEDRDVTQFTAVPREYVEGYTGTVA